jgi:hypothetical protein
MSPRRLDGGDAESGSSRLHGAESGTDYANSTQVWISSIFVMAHIGSVTVHEFVHEGVSPMMGLVGHRLAASEHCVSNATRQSSCHRDSMAAFAFATSAGSMSMISRASAVACT